MWPFVIVWFPEHESRGREPTREWNLAGWAISDGTGRREGAEKMEEMKSSSEVVNRFNTQNINPVVMCYAKLDEIAGNYQIILAWTSSISKTD